jgi:uncharacterized membrane protein
VLELKVPHGADLAALQPLWPVALSYALSFAYVGIYWNNHHHLFQAVKQVSGATLWSNLNLLFWLSLFPFVTGWMGENHFAPLTVVVYGVVLILAALSYTVLVAALLRCHPGDSVLAHAIGRDRKGKISLLLYAIGIALAYWQSWLGVAVYAIVAAIWFVPDRRIERALKS